MLIFLYFTLDLAVLYLSILYPLTFLDLCPPYTRAATL